LIHNVKPELLNEKINKIFDINLNPNGEIIFDIIWTENTNYKHVPNYNFDKEILHDISYLTSGLPGRTKEIKTYAFGCVLYSLEKSI